MKHDAALRTAGETEAPSSGPRSFLVEFRLRAGCEEEFLELLTPVLDAMRHERTFINAVLHRDPEEPTRFMLYETWSDLDDVVHVQIPRDYRKVFWDRLPALLAEPRRIGTWEPLRSDFAFFAAW